MRVIEKDMISAIKTGKTMYGKNTTVSYNVGGSARVELHGNRIADVFNNGIVSVDLRVLRRWPTPTTKSRLRALGVPVYSKNYQCYIGEKSIDDIPADFIDVDGVVL